VSPTQPSSFPRPVGSQAIPYECQTTLEGAEHPRHATWTQSSDRQEPFRPPGSLRKSGQQRYWQNSKGEDSLHKPVNVKEMLQIELHVDAAVSESTWLDILQKDEENRNYLRLVNTGASEVSENFVSLEPYDGDTGCCTSTSLLDQSRPNADIRSKPSCATSSGNYAGLDSGSAAFPKQPLPAYGQLNDGGASRQRGGDESGLSPQKQELNEAGNGSGCRRNIQSERGAEGRPI